MQMPDTDDDEIKLMYLQSCVLGDASPKIAHLIVSPENYGVARELLKASYEHKWLLVS